MARRSIVANLQRRFPNASEEEIEDALNEVDDHGGKATALLAKKHQPLPAGIKKSVTEEALRAAEFAEVQKLLEPYRSLSTMQLVDERSVAALKEALPDIPEATISVELLVRSGDFENAKSWLWLPDQGAASRREQATVISDWAHQMEGDIAMFSFGGWTKKRLVLDRETGTYAYTEKVPAQYGNTGSHGITRTRNAGGRWLVEVQPEGFLLAVRGSMKTANYNPQSGTRLDEQDEDHAELFWTTTAPWPDLEEARANPPTLTKADKIKRRFRAIDRNRDGTLDFGELRSMLTAGGTVMMSDKEVRALFNKLDKARKGYIVFDDFVDYLYPPENSASAQNNAIYGSWYNDHDYRQVLTKTASGSLG